MWFVPARSALMRRGACLAVMLALTVGSVACSGSDSSDSGQAKPSGSCPFSGDVVRATGGNPDIIDAKVTKIVTSRQDCIDSFQLDFTGGVPSWNVAYTTGPVTDVTGGEVNVPGAVATLAISLNGASYGPGGLPATLPTDGLAFVTGILVLDQGPGSVLVLIGLDDKKQFVASNSEDPAYLSLSIG